MIRTNSPHPPRFTRAIKGQDKWRKITDMRRHKKTLIYYDFAAKLWAKGYPNSVIMDAVLEKYGINLTNFNDLARRYRKDFPYRTEEESSLNKSTGGRFISVNREQRRKLVEKALASCAEDLR